jgi:hypothetical protein
VTIFPIELEGVILAVLERKGRQTKGFFDALVLLVQQTGVPCSVDVFFSQTDLYRFLSRPLYVSTRPDTIYLEIKASFIKKHTQMSIIKLQTQMVH